MSGFKQIPKCLMVLSVIAGLFFVIGCTDSEERHKVEGFLQEYSKTLDDYSDAVGKADAAKKTEIEGKIKSYDSRWSNMKMESADRLTPQDLDKFEHEYQKITQKYKDLSQKS
jgi:hypothetical protein